MTQYPGVNPNALSKSIQAYLNEQNILINTHYQKEALKMLVQSLMEVEIRQQTAAARYERNNRRRVYRNGYRESTWQTATGEITLDIPKLRQGSYYPAFLHAEHHLSALTSMAYLAGLDADTVLAWFYRTGIMACTPAEAGDIAAELNQLVEEHQSKLADSKFDYSFLKDIILSIDSHGRRIYRRIVLAVGETTGQQELIAHDVMHESDHAAYDEFVRTLSRRGVFNGVDVVSADAMGSLNAERRRLKTPDVPFFKTSITINLSLAA